MRAAGTRSPAAPVTLWRASALPRRRFRFRERQSRARMRDAVQGLMQLVAEALKARAPGDVPQVAGEQLIQARRLNSPGVVAKGQEYGYGRGVEHL